MAPSAGVMGLTEPWMPTRDQAAFYRIRLSGLARAFGDPAGTGRKLRWPSTPHQENISVILAASRSAGQQHGRPVLPDSSTVRTLSGRWGLATYTPSTGSQPRVKLLYRLPAGLRIRSPAATARTGYRLEEAARHIAAVSRVFSTQCLSQPARLTTGPHSSRKKSGGLRAAGSSMALRIQTSGHRFVAEPLSAEWSACQFFI